jgi:hypothetical protein
MTISQPGGDPDGGASSPGSPAGSQGRSPLESARGWLRPHPLGAGNATDAQSLMAAPVLTGFTLATIAVVAQSAPSFRWPGAVMAVLALAGSCLLLSVQAGFHARAFLYSPADVATWWPGQLDEPTLDWLRGQQRVDLERWRIWSTRSRLLYHVGSVIVFCGLALLVVPPTGSSQQAWRWIGTAVAAASGLLVIVSALRRWLGIRVASWRERRRAGRFEARFARRGSLSDSQGGVEGRFDSTPCPGCGGHVHHGPGCRYAAIDMARINASRRSAGALAAALDQEVTAAETADG